MELTYQQTAALPSIAVSVLQVLEADRLHPKATYLISRPRTNSVKMPSGGVCAHLDYEVDMMAEYIAEMAVELVTPRSAITGAFRKFCSQVLSSTRLPKTTILLGMNYLSKRVNGLKMAGPFHPHEGQVWRMLTIALLLGSKFLDDNTFQNRSWSEVSGIPVAELNKLENDWLIGIDWKLFVNLDQSEDYNAWLANWSEWISRKKMAQTLAARDRLSSLTPLQTDLGRGARGPTYDIWRQQQIAEYERYERSNKLTEASWNQYSAGPWPTAPLTPPDSGYGTPEYPASAMSGFGFWDWQSRPVPNKMAGVPGGQLYLSRHNPNPAPKSAHQPTRHAPYPYYHGQNIWEMNAGECNCANCTGSIGGDFHQHFMPVPAYGQAVHG